MGLRLSEGVELGRFALRAGMVLQDAVVADVLERSISANYAVLTGDRLIVTASGRLRLDALLTALLN